MQDESIQNDIFKDLDQLAEKEYGTTFVGALDGQSEEMFVKRLARLSGIPLKQPFAQPQKSDGRSNTNSLRYWELKPEIAKEVYRQNGPFPILESMGVRNAPALEIVKEMTKVRWNTEAPTLPQIADTIVNAQLESNWFTNFVLVIRPRLCKGGEKNKILIEGIKRAADEIANKSVESALRTIIEPVAATLVAAMPVLHFVPHLTIVGATYFIVKFAARSFCTTEIAPQFQMLLGANSAYESR